MITYRFILLVLLYNIYQSSAVFNSLVVSYNGPTNLIGCFPDSPHEFIRYLFKFHETFSDLVPSKCRDECFSRGYRYYGLNNQAECFCGDSIDMVDQMNSSMCSCPCAGNETLSCGCFDTTLISEILEVRSQCDVNGLQCGFNSICTDNGDGTGSCSCPLGTFGDPQVSCCDLRENMKMSCGCWADSHCASFDRVNFEFMGKCKYDLVSTSCSNKTMPSSMVPFNIKQRQNDASIGAWVKYLEVNVFGSEYRLFSNGQFFINGFVRPYPYSAEPHGIEVFMLDSWLVLTADFGLKVAFDGLSGKFEVKLCEAYRDHVCGLCGNADGNVTFANEFVDRQLEPVTIEGSAPDYNWFNWGSMWRVPVEDDTAIDEDSSMCNAESAIGISGSASIENCTQYSMYGQNILWCAYLESTTIGPWAECIKLLTEGVYKPIFEACASDLCKNKNDLQKQEQIRCEAYETLNAKCLNLMNSTAWRTTTSCPKICLANEEYKVSGDCPKTCMFPYGDYDCGSSTLQEGCFCKDGFVRSTSGECIVQEDCGCRLPDNSTVIQMGHVFITEDCQTKYECKQPQSSPNVTTYPPCSSNAHCVIAMNNPWCMCEPGFRGNGYDCNEIQQPTTTKEPVDPCLVCGAGATCEADGEGAATCSCPSGSSGDPYVRCCAEQMKCSCWGDPHCATFDNVYFAFMAKCKYDMVSTECYGSILPHTMEPFIIRQKNSDHGYTMAPISWIDYVELNVYGNSYRLLANKVFTKNGIERPFPYDDTHNVQVFLQGTKLVLTTDFGLTINYDGVSLMEISLCDAYRPYVCGMCGNADGNTTRANEFVDRFDNAVPISGPALYWQWLELTKYWKVNMEEQGAIDMDGSSCFEEEPNPERNETCPYQPGESFYEISQDWCGLIQNPSGPWAACLEFLDEKLLLEIASDCAFDLCQLSNDSSAQADLRCQVYQELQQVCINAADKLNTTFGYENWRLETNCPLNCGANEMYNRSSECPGTCLFPNGTYDCGELGDEEGCFCLPGYVRSSDGDCILPEDCGCRLPDGSTVISVGTSVVSEDCTEVYKCLESGTDPVVETYPPCSEDGYCTVNSTNNEPLPQCVCYPNYSGDGHQCEAPSCNNDFCYGFGDPHYRSQFGALFKINNTCSYVLASDNCFGTNPQYSVVVGHEDRYGLGSSYLKSIRIIYNGDIYRIIGKKFYVDVTETSLPFTGPGFNVYKEVPYIRFESSKMSLFFDGEMLLKLSLCQPFRDDCGLCKLTSSSSFPYLQQLDPLSQCVNL